MSGHSNTWCVPDDEFLVDTLVDDEVEVALSVPSLLVLEAKVEVWQHVEAWSKQGYF